LSKHKNVARVDRDASRTTAIESTAIHGLNRAVSVDRGGGLNRVWACDIMYLSGVTAVAVGPGGGGRCAATRVRRRGIPGVGFALTGQ
jgi:hypothetical protein